jgi:hypothetical protein
MDEFEIVIQKYCNIDRSFLAFADDDKLPKLKTGIIFIFAVWSGPAIAQFGLLTKILSKLELGKFKVFVLDTDTLNIEYLAEQGIKTPHGWGETDWIKNHRIEHFLARYNEVDTQTIISYTNDLLSERLPTNKSTIRDHKSDI